MRLLIYAKKKMLQRSLLNDIIFYLNILLNGVTVVGKDSFHTLLWNKSHMYQMSLTGIAHK